LKINIFFSGLIAPSISIFERNRFELMPEKNIFGVSKRVGVPLPGCSRHFVSLAVRVQFTDQQNGTEINNEEDFEEGV